MGKLIQRFCYAEAFVSLAELDYVQQVNKRHRAMSFCNLITLLRMYFICMAILNIRDIGMFIFKVLFKAKQVLLKPPGQEKTICEQSLTTATSMTKIIQVSDMYCNTSLNDFISKRMQGQSGSLGYKERGNQV